MNQFLVSDQPLEICFEGDVPLKDVASTLYNMAELVQGIAGMVKDPKEDEDYDPADAWKYQEE